MKWLRYPVGAVAGVVIGYVLGLGLFWAIDTFVMPLTLDAGWGFVEVGVIGGLLVGLWTVSAWRRAKRST